MWGALMAGAFFTAIDPVRLAILALLISRPRPLHNLLAYWLGALLSGIPFLLVPLLVLHATPIVTVAKDLPTNPTFRHVQFGIGVLALSIAVLMIVRTPARQRAARQRADVPARAGNTSTLVLDSNPPNPVTRLLSRSPDAASEGGSAIQLLLGRAASAWENGALWVAALLGVATGGPSLDGIVLGLAIIVTSGATLATQVTAAIVWLFAMLAIIEIILVSSLVAPERAQAVLQVVHDWVQTHRRKIVIAIMAVVGIALTAQNVGYL